MIGVTFSIVSRALARILNMPGVPVKKVDAARKIKSSAQQEASHHGWGPGACLRAPDGVQGQCPGREVQGAEPPEALGFYLF